MAVAIRSGIVALIASAGLSVAEPCSATTVSDPAGDILSTYLGPVGPGLDILQFTAELRGDSLFLEALLDGAPGATATSRYRIGVDRGAGTNLFPPGFRPDASFDATITLLPGTLTGNVLLFALGAEQGTTPLPAGSVAISGNSISASVPLSMLPSTGSSPQDYGLLFWSRTVAQGDPVDFWIADFAPNQGAVSPVPEPSTWALLVLGFGAIGTAMRRGRKAAGVPQLA
jgi:hypothetical protein